MQERKVHINTAEAREKKNQNNKENRSSLPDGKENPGKKLVTHSRLQCSLPTLKGFITKVAYDTKSK